MTDFNNINEAFIEVRKKLDVKTKKKKVVILYSFNGIGKTRLSNRFKDINKDGRLKYDRTLCYNAFLEDLFNWDNERGVFVFNSDSQEASLIKDEGLQDKIVDNFKEILNTRIEPSFSQDLGEITFNIPSDENAINIKISKGEESAFIWVVFYTILQNAIDILNDEEKSRSTPKFNKLKYVVIDDPVSSMDDANIITTAIKLIKTIESHKNNQLKFFITTHHPLFYNVITNLVRDKKIYNSKRLILSRKNNKLKLDSQNDSPFGYHLMLKKEIEKAINENDIKRYHFNFFRNILEKTANFLGYTNMYWCIPKKKRKEINRLIQLYSHSKLSEMESKELPEEHKTLFKESFNEFIKEFNWNVEND